ncbi:hypothetical protein DL93DRAFT_2088094 [Clavulina sp. PMI_390]|nr:hypothetical protein DL93DRAFT_2088094 [Clavulina sp. PMI_390]
MYMPNASPPNHPALLDSGLRDSLIGNSSSLYRSSHQGGPGGHVSLLAALIIISIIIAIIIIIILLWVFKQWQIRKRNQVGIGYNKPVHGEGATDSTINLVSAGAAPATGGAGFSNIVNSLTSKTGSYMPVANTTQVQSGNLGAYEPPVPPTVGAGYVSRQPYDSPTSWPPTSTDNPPLGGQSRGEGSYSEGGQNGYHMALTGDSQSTQHGSLDGYGSESEK